MSNITAANLVKSIRAAFENDVQNAKRRKAALHSPDVRNGFKTLAKVLKKALEFDESATHNEYVYANAMLVDADIWVKTNSLKSPEVEALIEFAEKHVAPASSSEDYASSSMAQRTFIHQGNGLRLNLCFRLPTDGEACSRKVVGMKMVEQKVYAIECA
jgi:hypothetical protein